MFWTKLKHSYIWKRILYERVTEPINLNLFSILVSLFGSCRAKIDFDLILRQHNAYGILRAAEARKLSLQSVTLIEFGVAAGAGLINMCKIAEKVSSMQFKSLIVKVKLLEYLNYYLMNICMLVELA
ncbi:hypothetical protein [Cylindrospermopsis raciborskii]|jgi:hypothetical protein|uniref:hypothetical protein n=1 Tax=Cylindrospermopsis raciborskii TaxID=77022 RepID=UPI001F1C4014|nr:hypothetical protein [Cylindrospermopsis raciborskii]UJS05653.1 hypothetical protein L3I90_05300 [Cylindrospermopsis raciborskii KLL07]